MTDRTEEKSKNPDAEVPEAPEKASRRRFDASYKLRILEEADRCGEPGQLGELLRREGLYSSSSHLSTWRKQRDEGALNGLREKEGKGLGVRATLDIKVDLPYQLADPCEQFPTAFSTSLPRWLPGNSCRG